VAADAGTGDGCAVRVARKTFCPLILPHLAHNDLSGGKLNEANQGDGAKKAEFRKSGMVEMWRKRMLTILLYGPCTG
jgi:hypothetical protein